MTTRIIFQIFLFVLPFLVFFIYTILSTEFRQKGEKTWPLNTLFLSGVGFVTLGWLIMVIMDSRQSKDCVRPPYMENGKLIPAQRIPCTTDRSIVGQARTDDPGLKADGVGPEGRPASSIRAAREVDAEEQRAPEARYILDDPTEIERKDEKVNDSPPG